MTTPDTPTTPDGLGGWREDSRVEARPDPMSAARAKMHAAVAVSPAAGPGLWSRLALVLTLPRRHPVVLAASSVAAAVLTVVAVGWNAPAGSTLHEVRLAREQIAVALAGGNPVSLRLTYAEDRLRDAVAGRNPAASLREAAELLDDARSGLPSDHGSALFIRWQDDEDNLHSLQDVRSPGAGSDGAQPSLGATPGVDGRGGDEGSSGAGAGDHGSAGGGSNGSQGSSQSASSAGSDGGERTSGGGTPSSPEVSPAPSAGGDGSGGSSSSSGSTGTDSSGGGGGTSSATTSRSDGGGESGSASGSSSASSSTSSN